LIKKLDKLILKAFVGPFVATFIVVMFILVLQIFWKYLDDMVGKGIGGMDMLNIVGIVAVTVVPLALPISVLVSGLLTFGRMGETFEIVAIKSAGISLMRFMRPLLITTIGICGIAFYFNNNIIPVANLRFYSFLSNIYNSRPAFDLKENVFYTKIDGYAIQIGKKGEDGRSLKNVKIYELGSNIQSAIISADSGSMNITKDGNFLDFSLFNGWRYEERGNRNDTSKAEYIRLGFAKYTKLFDLSKFGIKDLSDSNQRNNLKVLTMGQLQENLDSLYKTYKKQIPQIHTTIVGYVPILGIIDSTKQLPDSIKKLAVADSARSVVLDLALSKASSLQSSMDPHLASLKDKSRSIRQHNIEWQRKITLSIACLMMFLIGAPLGSIIRKGGLGMPLLFAVVFFVIFFLLNNFGERLAKEGKIPLLIGMWLSNIVLGIIGLFLLSKARNDSQLFNKEYYHRLWSKLKPYIPFIVKKNKANNAAIDVAVNEEEEKEEEQEDEDYNINKPV
jgi:lipopolysaccharide export system permease protein